MIAEEADKIVALATGRFAGLLRRYVPDLVSSLHLIGSAADGDFRPGRSDLDFVAVLAHPATEDEIEALVILHRTFASDPTLPALDGIWVTEADLAAGPDACGDGPSSHDNQFLELARGNRNPVTWTMLRQNGVILAGELDCATLWHDPARLASWALENVERYWVPWHARASNFLSAPSLAMLGGGAPMGGVLGISRLHDTLGTGGVVSKFAAGEHALADFDERWHKIIRECLRIRRGERGSFYRNPFQRRREALDFVEMAIEVIRASYRASE
ncbi:MAG: nucleotidyltransferase domain-containing protein [Devosia sp.]